mmetsp:Transcript_13648/g.32080  ORF Transcript_13648/g.32080 Transcript_13648/m.32080 type:complete len:205 (-) Transcript_13648:61-675(-)
MFSNSDWQLAPLVAHSSAKAWKRFAHAFAAAAVAPPASLPSCDQHANSDAHCEERPEASARSEEMLSQKTASAASACCFSRAASAAASAAALSASSQLGQETPIEELVEVVVLLSMLVEVLVDSLDGDVAVVCELVVDEMSAGAISMTISPSSSPPLSVSFLAFARSRACGLCTLSAKSASAATARVNARRAKSCLIIVSLCPR